MNTSDLKVSLVIPAYNEEKYIKDCLDYAIKNSQNRFFEIIVVDNASKDHTKEIAESVPGVRVVYESQKGLTKARQRGFLEAKGDILAYIDADTQMRTGWYDKIIKEFKKDPTTTVVSGPYTYYDMSWFKNFLVRLWYIGVVFTYWVTGYVVTGGNFAIKRDVLEKMGGFDTSIVFYGEDTDIARRAYKFGRVAFKTGFVMPTSGRRLRGQGILNTGYQYGLNFFSEVFRHKPATTNYTDIR